MRPAKVVFFLLCLGAAFAQTGDLKQRLQRALSSSGESDQAVNALSKRNYEAVEQMLAAQPAADAASRAELLSLRGVVAFLREDMKTAAENFAAAAMLAPLSDADTFTDAMALVNVGPKAEARRLLELLAHNHPERPIYVYWLGKLDYDEHRYEQAAEELKHSIALDPNSARAWDSLGLTFDMQGRAAEAHDAFEKAAALNRSQPHPSPWPPHDLGYWLFRSDRQAEAEAALREALRYDPAFPQAHYHLGRVLEKLGRNSEAVTEYETAVQTDRKAADACYSLALLYRKLNRGADADAMFAQYRRRRQAQP